MLPMAMQCRARPRYCDFHPSWSDADAFPPPPSSQATGDVRRGKGKNKEKGQPLNTNEFSEAQREERETEKGMNSWGRGGFAAGSWQGGASTCPVRGSTPRARGLWTGFTPSHRAWSHSSPASLPGCCLLSFLPQTACASSLGLIGEHSKSSRSPQKPTMVRWRILHCGPAYL